MGRADFVSFALTNDNKKRRYVNDTFDANSMAQTRCYVNDTVNGVGQSIRQPELLYFPRPTFYQGQQSAISVSKELGDGITKRPLCSPAPDYVKTFFPSRQRDLFGPIRKMS